jgi:hypothetical protein
MRRTQLVNLTAVLLSFLCSFALLGQWPKSSDAQPDPNGPAPTTADGKPDFSGVWTSGGAGKDGKDKAKDKDKGPPPFGEKGKGDKGKGKDKGPPPLAAGAIPSGDFRNIGADFPGGLLPYQESALTLRNLRLARNSADHPDAHCLPLNPIQLWFHPQPLKLIQNAKEIVLLAEANAGTRQIFTDGRALPGPDAQPWWYGYSTAKWDGDTLVVESNGFLDDAWIDENGSPLSNEAKVTERIRRPNYGTLVVEITVNDPKTYTRPWTVVSLQRLMPNDELIEFVCGENNTNLQHLVTK